jgi:hypothetical protein
LAADLSYVQKTRRPFVRRSINLHGPENYKAVRLSPGLRLGLVLRLVVKPMDAGEVAFRG